MCFLINKTKDHRQNYDCDSPEKYYRIEHLNLYCQRKYSLIFNFETRFKQNTLVLWSIKIPSPKFALNENVLKLKSLNVFYQDHFSKKK